MTCYVFKGAGGYLAWYLGYAHFLQNHVDLSDAKFAGTSAGSIVASFLAAEVPMNEVWQKWFIPTLRELPEHFQFPNSEFSAISRKHVCGLFTPEAFNRTKGRLHVALTDCQLNRTSIGAFGSRDQLIDCVIASCHLPWLLDGTSTTEYGGGRYMDGSVYATLNGGREPYLPCGSETCHTHIQVPFRVYQQIASLRRFADEEFHCRNYIDGYRFAERQARAKKSIEPYATRPLSPHFDQSTVSL